MTGHRIGRDGRGCDEGSEDRSHPHGKSKWDDVGQKGHMQEPKVTIDAQVPVPGWAPRMSWVHLTGIRDCKASSRSMFLYMCHLSQPMPTLSHLRSPMKRPALHAQRQPKDWHEREMPDMLNMLREMWPDVYKIRALTISNVSGLTCVTCLDRCHHKTRIDQTNLTDITRT